ncbi:DUF6132 family protein [Eisenibacter elegans]|jgi:hypothetical protein|uniref:DUF6132 family protein n=1 Tax=Eisenibacter elegans TaxID=997 RepID=UPI0004068C8C|nr:DUF6132 family protein [Eisenibacter elegans]
MKRYHTLPAYAKLLLASGIGALFGWLYWYYIGCTSGSCPITANPWISTAYGALLGATWGFPAGKKADAKATTAQNIEQ